MHFLYLLSVVTGLVAAAPQYTDSTATKSVATQRQGPTPTDIKQVFPYDDSSSLDKKITNQVPVDPIGRHETSGRREMLERLGVLGRTGSCVGYEQGHAPKTSPDTAQAFLDNPVYSKLSTNSTPPPGYSRVFQNLNGSVEQPGFMGVVTYEHYNTVACQRACDAAVGCTAFNMYIERSPSVDTGAGCPNPPAVFNYRCSLWGFEITSATATMTGRIYGPIDANGTSFHSAVRGSNGYVKNAAPAPQPDFRGPFALGGAIQEPHPPATAAAESSTYIGQRNWPGTFEPARCAAACQATTAYNKEAAAASGAATYTACNFFNAFVVTKDNVAQGTTCYFFSKAWDRKYATDVGQYDGAGVAYSVSSSYGYALDVPRSGVVAPVAADAQ